MTKVNQGSSDLYTRIPEEAVGIVKDNGSFLNHIMTEARILTIGGDLLTPLDIDDYLDMEMRRWGFNPSCKGYHGYPKVSCISVNDVLVHGIPGGRKFKKGDIVTVDCALNRGGYHVDKALAFSIGENEENSLLLQTAYKALDESIKVAVPGNTNEDIGHKTHEVILEAGFAITTKFTGHGIGTKMHMLPAIPNYGIPGSGLILEPGMMIAIEPMVLHPPGQLYRKEDGWTIATLDGSKSCHCEDTVLLTEEGNLIITR